uniref:Uncharacterized protein n=1 Tax=Trichogramma kaykai TaxID=54128 RepID=A0ABD2XJE4_9HYME
MRLGTSGGLYHCGCCGLRAPDRGLYTSGCAVRAAALSPPPRRILLRIHRIQYPVSEADRFAHFFLRYDRRAGDSAHPKKKNPGPRVLFTDSGTRHLVVKA